MALFRSPIAAKLRAAARCLSCGLILLMGWNSSLHAQAPSVQSAPAAPAFHGFDVISVKPNKTGSGGMSINTGDTTFQGENISLKMLLINAYGIRDGLIFGLPPWALSARWDISAKIVDPDPGLKDRKPTREQSQEEYHAECRSILTERFHLKAHEEIKVQPIYDLVIAKDGFKLKPSDAAAEKRGSMMQNNTSLTAYGIPVSSLTVTLANETSRNVVDKTGLTADYDMELKWTREDQAVNAADNGSTDKPPTIFTALEEQLGLKLVPDKGPVTTLVVDAIAMPEAD